MSKQVVEGISPPLYIYADVPVCVGDAVGRHETLLKTRPWCVSQVSLELACLHIAPTARF
jgi:hypothetical protein